MTLFFADWLCNNFSLVLLGKTALYVGTPSAVTACPRFRLLLWSKAVNSVLISIPLYEKRCLFGVYFVSRE